MPITVPDLPYAKDALEPHMSERTISFHFEKHHKGYATKLNAAIEGTPLEGQALEDIIRSAAADPSKAGIFNNAAQVWNHSLFWESLSPSGGGQPSGDLADMITDSFDGLDGFKKTFAEKAAGRFGSGYAWLVLENGVLNVIDTANAETPLVGNAIPLLAFDVWEHAYYLDYQNERPKFIAAFLDHLIDWEGVAKRLADAPKAAFGKAA